MSWKEKKLFYEVLEKVKFPHGYASNILRCIHNKKLSGLKTHDCHVIMQKLLPLALRGIIDQKMSSVLVELCTFFQVLCSKVLKMEELNLLEEKIALTLCNMEKLFVPSFFTIMIHLVSHLATEAKIAGPIYYRWMYPIERYLCTLKSYVHNRAYPEGSIAETYLANKCLTFSSRYMEGHHSRYYRSSKGKNEIEHQMTQEGCLFPIIGQPYGKIEVFMMDHKTWLQAHRYVLFNCESDTVKNYRNEHLHEIRRSNRKRCLKQHQVDCIHFDSFHDWFKE